MSDAGVLHDVSSTLRGLLNAQLNGGARRPPSAVGGSTSQVTVTVDSPQRPEGDELRVNLFLYHITQDEGRRNSGGWIPVGKSATAATFAAEPLALKLYFLLSAFAVDGLTEHRLLGEAMQVLYQNRIIPKESLKGPLRDSVLQAPQIEVSLLNLDVDTLHKIWGNLGTPLRASAAYEVRTLFLDAGTPDAEVPLIREVVSDLIAVPYLGVVAPEEAAPGATVRIYGANLDARSPAGDPLVRIWFGDTVAAAADGARSNRAVGVIVPSLPPGDVSVRAELGELASRAVRFRVLAP